jgi:hypothetical protein
VLVSSLTKYVQRGAVINLTPEELQALRNMKPPDDMSSTEDEYSTDGSGEIRDDPPERRGSFFQSLRDSGDGSPRSSMPLYMKFPQESVSYDQPPSS